MNLTQTIKELEQEAARFTQAANALRALQQNGSAPAAISTKQAVKPTAKPSSKGSKAKKKSNVSPETRAKISAALKAAHAAKKAAT